MSRSGRAHPARALTEEQRHGVLGKTLADLGLLLLSSLLFALSFPSFLSDWGWFPLGFVCLAPLFVVVHRAGWAQVPFYGLFFGYVSYALFNYWLGKFHPLTLVVVPPIYASYFLLVLPALKMADSLFPVYGFLPQSALWVCYEYFLKSSGFLAYSYGNIGYSQYLFLPFIRSASLFGVWGVSWLVVIPSALVAAVLRDGWGAARKRLAGYTVPILAYAAFFTAAVCFGLLSRSDLSGARQWKMALVQQNVDPWRGGYEAYKESLEADLRQSDRALTQKPDIVVWSETSFVPAIDWHTRYRPDEQIYGLVDRLIRYLKAHDVPFVVGNDDGELRRLESGEEIRVDYNAAILFEKGRIVDTYRKIHLVPFTESFPFKKTLPGIYAWLKSADTHFWEKGDVYTVFQADGVRFSTPICFEDTFGSLCREFFRHGADILVNMTNDAWSFSVPCAMQHMAMAVFRAVENKRSVVRSTNGGITCIIDPNGRITERLPPFVEGYLVGEVPIYTAEKTPYDRWGDWFPWALLAIGPLPLLLGAVWRIKRGKKRAPEAA
jgi:apolipoprotein N-acyltransferase